MNVQKARHSFKPDELQHRGFDCCSAVVCAPKIFCYKILFLSVIKNSLDWKEKSLGLWIKQDGCNYRSEGKKVDAIQKDIILSRIKVITQNLKTPD